MLAWERKENQEHGLGVKKQGHNVQTRVLYKIRKC